MDNKEKPVYRNFHMTSRVRKLRDGASLKAEKRHMRLRGLKPQNLAGWVNRNLIDFMNQEPSPAVRRVTKVAEMLREAARMSEELRLLDSEDARMSQLRKLNRIMPELKAAIYPYVVHPTVQVYMSRTGPPLIASYLCAARTAEEANERRAIQVLVENSEIIGRIRRCRECRMWFFAVNDHQKFCADKCRVRHASHSDDFKAKRALYMRERYRPKEKEKDLNAKKQVAKESKGR